MLIENKVLSFSLKSYFIITQPTTRIICARFVQSVSETAFAVDRPSRSRIALKRIVLVNYALDLHRLQYIDSLILHVANAMNDENEQRSELETQYRYKNFLCLNFPLTKIVYFNRVKILSKIFFSS